MNKILSFSGAGRWGLAFCLLAGPAAFIFGAEGGAEAPSGFDFSFTIEEFNATVRQSHLLIEAIIQVESGGNASRVGQAGERGLMQIKRETWGDVCRSLYGEPLPFDLAFDPGINRCVGAAYLSYLQDFIWRYCEPLSPAEERDLLLACYNVGPERVRSGGFAMRLLPRMTQDYVQRVCALHDYYLLKMPQAEMFSMLVQAKGQ